MKKPPTDPVYRSYLKLNSTASVMREYQTKGKLNKKSQVLPSPNATYKVVFSFTVFSSIRQCVCIYT